MTTPKEIKGWVLYDGACGFCSWWIPFWGDLLASKGFKIEPLQAKWVQKRTGFTEEELTRDIRGGNPGCSREVLLILFCLILQESFDILDVVLAQIGLKYLTGVGRNKSNVFGGFKLHGHT